jgi:hypothetical protein
MCGKFHNSNKAVREFPRVVQPSRPKLPPNRTNAGACLAITRIVCYTKENQDSAYYADQSTIIGQNRTMKCPNCNDDMQKCKIWGDRYSLKWNYDSDGKLLGIWIKNGTEIGHGGMWALGRPYIYTHRCARCRTQLILEDEN